MKPVMAFLDRVVSLIARGPWHWDWWPLEEGAWPLQIMEKVMVDSNFRRRPWRPSRKGGRSRWPSLIMGNGLAHRLDSPLWELRLDGPTGRTKLANHRQWKPLMIALGT